MNWDGLDTLDQHLVAHAALKLIPGNPYSVTLEDVIAAGDTATTKPIFNGGISLGTSGIVESAVANGTSPVFHLLDTVTRTGLQTLAEISSSDAAGSMWMTATNLGEFSFGYGTTATPIVLANSHVLSFIHDSSTHPSFATRGVDNGIMGLIQHNETVLTPTDATFGVKGIGYLQGGSFGAATICMGGLLGIGGSALDSNGLSTRVLVGVLGDVAGSVVASDYNSKFTGTGDVQVTSQVPFGNWSHVSNYWARFRAYNKSSGLPSNRPAISSAARLPIQGFASDIQCAIYGEAVQPTSPTNNVVVQSFFARVPFPLNTSATNRTHLYFIPVAAGAAGPTWNANGGHYVDDGTTNTLGHYHYDGAAWYYHLSQKNAAAAAVPAQVGGAVRTFDTVGAAGPANAALQGWIQVQIAIDGAGTRKVAVWIPYWT